MVELDKANIERKLLSSALSFDDSKMFKELMNLYPWCSSFTVAYLKALKTKNDLRFSSELEKHAIELNSRSVIYDLTQAMNHEKIEAGTNAVLIQESEGSQEIFESEKEASEENPLDKLIESEALAAKVLKELKEDVTEQENKMAIVPDTSAEPLVTNKKNIDVEAPRSFNDWLNAGSDSNNIGNKKEYLTFEKPKVPFFSPVKKAKESLGIENLPVSETLAKVFESQGNYTMAKTTYEQLIFIFPEKKSFFADQIQKLNNKLI